MLASLKRALRLFAAETSVAFWQFKVSEPHSLPAELIVSLTSYPKRFPTLAKTLESLLAQSVRPDRITLWIAHEDRDSLPPDVLDLPIEIWTCEDLRSYKKIIPALREFPKAYICTADDDIYYPRDWLKTLVSASAPGVITCRRAHRPNYVDGDHAPYGTWEWCVVTDEPGDLFPTGCGGILYPPGSLSPNVLDPAFLEICPTADDVWLYMMAREAGSIYRQVGGTFHDISWPGSQDEALMSRNLDGGNDHQIAAACDFLSECLSASSSARAGSTR